MPQGHVGSDRPGASDGRAEAHPRIAALVEDIEFEVAARRKEGEPKPLGVAAVLVQNSL
jgi:hypothetical protein